MAITEKKPSTKLTVGAQYICFNTGEPDWSASAFETAVTKLPTVVDIDVADNADSYESYASGDVYESDTIILYKDISVTQLVFPEDVLARMRGDTVDEGVILSGGIKTRPHFAYGVPVIKKDGTSHLRWFPKCKLIENSDKTATSTETHSDQTDTLTIRAYGFDADQNQDVGCLTSIEGNEGITEDLFFAAPLLTIAEVKALRTETTETTETTS